MNGSKSLVIECQVESEMRNGHWYQWHHGQQWQSQCWVGPILKRAEPPEARGDVKKENSTTRFFLKFEICVIP
jgi:hypothetical protein